MSSPNTSASQTDNCRDSKAISLSQPISSLPPPAGDGRPEPTAPDRITDKRWQHIWRQPNKKISDVRASRFEM